MNEALIIIPAHNESENIAEVIKTLLLLPVDIDILVINDGSTDDTECIVKQFPVHLLCHACNMGYGAALKTGYTFAKRRGYRYVIQFDGDGQHNPADVVTIMSALTEGYDVVLGSRFKGDAAFHPGAAKMPVIRFFRSCIFRLSGQRITDPTSGLRGLSRTVFTHYVDSHMASDFPDADLLIDMGLRGFSITEVPVLNRKRLHGTSMHTGIKSLLYIWKVLLSILVVLIHHQAHRKKLPT